VPTTQYEFRVAQKTRTQTRTREGRLIYQLAAFSINDFHPEAAKQMFLKRLGVASRDTRTPGALCGDDEFLGAGAEDALEALHESDGGDRPAGRRACNSRWG
jgi:hypothetical protein